MHDKHQSYPTSENPPRIGGLSDVLSGPLGSLVVRNLRVLPRQVRSIDSVERIISAAAAMTFRQRTTTISIEKVSMEAGVTPQAAYRYFKDADDLVEMGLRCIVVREHEQVIRLLSRRVLSDDAEMARAVVGIVIESCVRLSQSPAHLQDAIFRHYRQVGYDASLLISELLCRDVDGTDVRRSLDVVKASVALTMITAVATSFFSRRIVPPQHDRLEDLLANLFVGVLQSGGRSSDAFREMESELDAFWRSGAGANANASSQKRACSQA
jgi:AcrR family transcriptional regulator